MIPTGWSTWLVVGLVVALVGGGVFSCRARDAGIAERARYEERARQDSIAVAGLKAQLDADRTALLARTQVTERVIERWRERPAAVKTVPVRDTTGRQVTDAAGKPQLAVPLPAYEQLGRQGDSLAAECSLLAVDCKRFQLTADSTIAAQQRQIANLTAAAGLPRPTNGRGVLGTVIRVLGGGVAGYVAGRASCPATP